MFTEVSMESQNTETKKESLEYSMRMEKYIWKILSINPRGLLAGEEKWRLQRLIGAEKEDGKGEWLTSEMVTQSSNLAPWSSEISEYNPKERQYLSVLVRGVRFTAES